MFNQIMYVVATLAIIVVLYFIFQDIIKEIDNDLFNDKY